MESKIKKLKILITPLNWGIGHATRCVPIIDALLQQKFEPIIASDGDALLLLKEQFPKLTFYTLPSYKISYPKQGFLMHLHLFLQSRKILKVIKEEKKVIAKIIKKEAINGIISDNRFGAYSTKIPSVYITHQLKVKSGLTTFISTKLHQTFIKNFTEVWIPDNKNSEYSGELSAKSIPLRKKFIGILSRLTKDNLPIKNDILVLLSGPEPQRTLLEKKLITEFKTSNKKILFVRGLVNVKENLEDFNACKIVNYLNQQNLQKEMNRSKMVIARSGYSTIMDVAKLNKKVFFIPTPGQSEQIYLAHFLKRKKMAPFVKQHKFNLNTLKEIENYSGFKDTKNIVKLDFSVFITNLT